MDRKSRRLTNVASGVAAVTAFVTQPIPGGDELVVVPIHYALAVKLARARGVPVTKLPWRAVQRIIWFGAAGRLVANFSLGLVPVLGAFSNSITAVALTEYLSRWLDGALAHPEAPPPEPTFQHLRELFTGALRRSGAARPASAPEAP